MDSHSGETPVKQLYVELAKAIADAKDVDALDLDPLYYEIDVEAVAHVLTSGSDVTTGQPEVTFTAAECAVTVTAGPTIDVVPQTPTPADD